MQGDTNAEMTDIVLMVKLSPVGIYQTIELSMPLYHVSQKMENFVDVRQIRVAKEPTKH